MLTKIQKILAAIVIGYWALYAVSNAVHTVDLAFRYNRFEHTPKALTLLLAAFLICFVGRRVLVSRVQIDLSSIRNNSVLLFSGYCKIYSVYCCLILMTLIGVFSYFTLPRLLHSTAPVFDSLQYYEIAERLYSFSSSKACDESHASKRTCFLPVRDSVSESRTKAVSAVYGAKSPEMAGRLFFVGLNIEQQEDYNDRAFPYFSKSYALYKELNLTQQSMNPLVQMIAYRYFQKRYEETRQLLREASSIENNASPTQSSGELLNYIAEKVEYKGARFSERSIKNSGVDSKRLLDFISSYSMLLLSIAGCVGFNGILIRRVFFFSSASRDQNSFGYLVQSKIDSIDKSLFIGDILKASMDSEHLSRLVGIEPKVVIDQEVCRDWQKREGQKANMQIVWGLALVFLAVFIFL